MSRVCIVVWSLLVCVVACGKRAGAPCDGGACDEVDASVDAARPDAAPDTCEVANPCPDGETCVTTCVPTHDRCEGVVCPAGTTCADGACVSGCFPPSACLGVDCGPDGYCVNGTCQPIVPCSKDCGPGFACHVTCRGTNPCDNVSCDADELCYEGTCIDNPCFGVTCPTGSACNAGECVATCECPDCGSGSCVLNTCQCVPDCMGKSCGEDDSCGGECDVPCAEGGQYECTGTDELSCQCVPNCAGKQCGDGDGCGGECTVSPCADMGEVCIGSGTGYMCACPVGRAECSGDCCSANSDKCRTDNQIGTGTGGTAPTAEACCAASDACTDPARNTVCCTGAGLSCVDSDNDGDTESCCTGARQCNDVTGPDTNQLCCGAGETCIDTTIDPDTQRETCCASNKACGEIGTCCGAGTYCSTRPGANNDLCCADTTINCDGACVPKCNGGAPNKCNDGIAGNEVCCAGNETFCDGQCTPKCAGGQTQYQCNDGTPGNELCCAAGQVLVGGACCTPTCPDPSSAACGTMDSCGTEECEGTCSPGMTCLEAPGGGPDDWSCAPTACSPVCNTAACYDCVGGTCKYRCGSAPCVGGQCIIL